MHAESPKKLMREIKSAWARHAPIQYTIDMLCMSACIRVWNSPFLSFEDLLELHRKTRGVLREDVPAGTLELQRSLVRSGHDTLAQRLWVARVLAYVFAEFAAELFVLAISSFCLHHKASNQNWQVARHSSTSEPKTRTAGKSWSQPQIIAIPWGGLLWMELTWFCKISNADNLAWWLKSSSLTKFAMKSR